MSTKDKLDPTLADVLAILHGTSLKVIETRSGVTAGTLRNWRNGKTRSPQNKTMEFAIRALGYKRVIVRDQ